jgi:hypothetical protein
VAQCTYHSDAASTLQQVQGVYSVNQSDVNELALVAAEQDNREAAIDTFWLSLKTKGHTAVPFTVSTVGSQSVVTYRLTAFGSQFPFPRKAGPDLAELHLLVRTVAPQLPYGWNAASFGATATFLDNVNKQVRHLSVVCMHAVVVSPFMRVHTETSAGDQHAVCACFWPMDRHLLLW